VLRAVPAYQPEPCDCPACTGEEIDLGEMVDDLLEAVGELSAEEDPIEPELLAAMFFAAGRTAGEEFDEAFTEEVVPMLAAAATSEAFGLILALDLVRSSPATAGAIGQLARAGVAAPKWATAARESLTGSRFHALRFEQGVASMLTCTFERAGRSHAFIVRVDHSDCHAAIGIQLVPGEVLDEFLAQVVPETKKQGLQVAAEDLTPEDFRWEIERALDARAVHDQEDGEPPEEGPDGRGDEGEPDYGVLAELLRSRMRTLPVPSRPPARHDDSSLLASISQIAEMAEQFENKRLKRLGKAKLPPKPKRKKGDGPAPIYRIKVSLKGAKPPIWRRLEVPADTTLARLHRIIQAAFGWDDSHLHVFRTAYGEFGVADRELEHRSEVPVTLEQVAPAARERFTYLYDFGDNWLHELVVEDVLDREQARYPRCTGGRRAAPAEDSGGIWGYEELIAVLADPDHPEHLEAVESLGLESAADFQPDRFDPAAVNEALARLK
jgi:pRiA4b ORF-3-like protein